PARRMKNPAPASLRSFPDTIRTAGSRKQSAQTVRLQRAGPLRSISRSCTKRARATASTLCKHDAGFLCALGPSYAVRLGVESWHASQAWQNSWHHTRCTRLACSLDRAPKSYEPAQCVGVGLGLGLSLLRNYHLADSRSRERTALPWPAP